MIVCESWETVLSTHVWQFLTIKELGYLMCVNTNIRLSLSKNHLVVSRLNRFVACGLRVLDYYKSKSNGLFKRERLRYQVQVKLLRKFEPVIFFPCDKK